MVSRLEELAFESLCTYAHWKGSEALTWGRRSYELYAFNRRQVDALPRLQRKLEGQGYRVRRFTWFDRLCSGADGLRVSIPRTAPKKSP